MCEFNAVPECECRPEDLTEGRASNLGQVTWSDNGNVAVKKDRDVSVMQVLPTRRGYIMYGVQAEDVYFIDFHLDPCRFQCFKVIWVQIQPKDIVSLPIDIPRAVRSICLKSESPVDPLGTT